MVVASITMLLDKPSIISKHEWKPFNAFKGGDSRVDGRNLKLNNVLY
jgi:hypothetical protein